MHHISRLTLIVIAVFLDTPSFAATGATEYRNIDYVRIGGGFIRVFATLNWNDPSSCDGSASNQSVLVLNTDPHYEEIVSAILAAKFADR